jgi:pimeloyl-ACP methyl ester carboxylesterase
MMDDEVEPRRSPAAGLAVWLVALIALVATVAMVMWVLGQYYSSQANQTELEKAKAGSTAIAFEVSRQAWTVTPIPSATWTKTATPTLLPTYTRAPSSTMIVTPTRFFPTATPKPCQPESAVPTPGPSNLKAIYRSGQTFITWPERTGMIGERYRIYRLECQITTGNFMQAVLLGEVGKDSARFYANRYRIRNSTAWKPRYLDRLVIKDNSLPIPVGTGLLVWTLAQADFKGLDKGDGYYAVSVVEPDGNETLDPFNTIGPVNEAVADPQPVEITLSTGTKIGSGGRIYIQYMDLRHWNATFHAPSAVNRYYGLNPNNPNLAGALVYAYDYAIYGPTADWCGGKVPDVVGAIIRLHGWGDNDYRPYANSPDSFCAYAIYPVDVSETWWFGFARQHDYRQPGEVAAGDVIENYTEQRVLRMLYDLQKKQPRGGPRVDPLRYYVFGDSMGGTGTVAFAQHFPNIFAAAYANQPLTNLKTAGFAIVDRPTDAGIKWGKTILNLPVSLSAPGNWAAPILQYNGVGVWDWQNMQENLIGSSDSGKNMGWLAKRMAQDLTPMGFLFGVPDDMIPFTSQAKPFIKALNDSRQVWGGLINGESHKWQGWIGLPVSFNPLKNKGPFWNFSVVRNETMPGLSNLSSNRSLPPNGEGSFNQTILWSSSWDDWDGKPVDEPDRWQISLCSTNQADPACKGKEQKVDVTPRRVQKFLIVPGLAYDWINISIPSGKVLKSGTVMADQYGLITVKGFYVSAEGNRLVIRPHK